MIWLANISRITLDSDRAPANLEIEMSNRNEQMNDDLLEPRTGVRILSNNEVEAVAGANFFMLLASGVDVAKPHGIADQMIYWNNFGQYYFFNPDGLSPYPYPSSNPR